MQVGHKAPGVDRRARGESVERARSGGHRLLRQLIGTGSGGREDRVRAHRLRQRQRVRVVRVPERDQLGQRSVRQRREFGIHERLVGAGGAAHRLGRVVDQDVERSLRRDRVGEPDHLGGVAQVDAHHAQAVDPLVRIGQAREAPHGVAREAGRDRRVRAVAQQPQGDVHADLGAAAGQQCALSREIGAGFPLGVAHGRTCRAELVVERVDLRVRLLADVARPRDQQRACCRRAGPSLERDAARLVIDPVGRSGRGGRDHRTVGIRDQRPLLQAPLLLGRLEHVRGRAPDGAVVGMLRVDLVQLSEHLEGDLELGRVDAARGRVGWGIGGGHIEFYLARHRRDQKGGGSSSGCVRNTGTRRSGWTM